MKRDKCIYRSTAACRFPVSSMQEEITALCTLCLAGQQIDSIELLTSAIMEKRMDKLEDEMYEPN